MSRLLTLSLFAIASSAALDSAPSTIDPVAPARAPDRLPIRFENAHGTASANHYTPSSGTRQRKRRKQQRQRGRR